MEERRVFLDDNRRPYMTRPWGHDNKIWLFYWHKEGHWTSLREVTGSDVFADNLSLKDQGFYHAAHDKWEESTSCINKTTE